MRWDIKGLIGLQLLAVGLFVSWQLGLWQGLDDGVFWWFNRQIVNSPSFAEFVAFANQRGIDGGVALLMLAFSLRYASLAVGRERARIFALLAVMSTCFVSLQLAGKAYPLERPSPTVLYQNSVRVSSLVPNIKTKDKSRDSFPGDHGVGLATFLLFAIYRFPRRYLVVIAPTVFLLALPRIMSGAHWVTDFLCGSAPLVLIAGAWLFHTPLATRLTEALIAPAEWLLQRLRLQGALQPAPSLDP